MDYELLSPAGSPEKLDAALLYGADAVYLAGKSFGLRASAANFDGEELRGAVGKAHALGKKVYVAANIMPRDEEVERMPEFFAELSDAGADAAIVSDIGVLTLAKRCAPGLALHVSTQASVVNSYTANVWHELGASRIVLARELTLREIARVRAQTPDSLELEAFVHGAMCMSYSGRCLLSNYLTAGPDGARDANRGQCAQPCRWSYALVEEKRPGQYMPVEETEEGSFILNSRDLCMLGRLRDLADAGVTSFKIEGRMKTAYYAAVVTNAYAAEIRALRAGRELPDAEAWRREVGGVSHRPYSTGFYYGGEPGQNYPTSDYIRLSDCCAVVERAGSPALLRQKNRITEGETIELLPPGELPVPFEAAGMRLPDGTPVASTPHPHELYTMELPRKVPAGTYLRRSVEKD